MTTTRLDLFKGYNNGILSSTLYTYDADETATVFDLTGATLSMEIYNEAGTVLATISGTISASPTTGEFAVVPGASSLNALTSQTEYFYRIKVVNASYAQGLLFTTDSDGNRLRCYVT